MKTRVLFAFVLLAACGAALADVSKVFRVEEQFDLADDGTLILENTEGNIEIFGSDSPGVSADVQKTVLAVEPAGLEEGREMTMLVVRGNDRHRMLQVQMKPGRTRPWSSSVYWRVRVPRTAHLRIAARGGQFIRVFNMQGNVFIRNFNGNIALENVTGMVNTDSVNGSISYHAPSPRGDVRLASVNGHVTARVNTDADIKWVADTVAGDIRTNLPVRGMFTGTTFRGSVNAPGGPTITTTSLTGNIWLVGTGLQMASARSLRRMKPEMVWVPPAQQGLLVGTQRGGVVEKLDVATQVGDVIYAQVRGNANVLTRAGQVQLGEVNGDAVIRSQGGSLMLGEIFGVLQASTRAGDILVDSARRGGSLNTTGGTIRLLYSGGPTHMTSGGGDIVLRQAAGPVHADTRSGDIFITLDRGSAKQKVQATTEKGNVMLNVPSNFAGDFELTVITSDAQAHTIHSDLPGLSFSRDQFEGKTRIRATGRINGGGERVALQAVDGSIRLVTGMMGPTLVGR
jgi:DUF4097 and DUF4098 domain-containing protein YvlB